MTNPLLSFDDLPLFDQVQPGHIEPAINALLAQADTALATVTQAEFEVSWNAIARVLDVATERLSRAWGTVSHLNSVADTPELRAAYNAALPKITEFYTRLGADERLFAKYKAIDATTLTPEQRQAHRNALRNDHRVLHPAGRRRATLCQVQGNRCDHIDARATPGASKRPAQLCTWWC